MFKSSRKSSFNLEALEDRRLMSVSISGVTFAPLHQVKTIEFSQAPALVQTGLDALAGTDQLTAPTSTQPVSLGNSDGIETYSVTLGSTGAETILVVDQNGDAVSAASTGKTTFGTLSGTGTNSNSAAAAEIDTIAAALNLRAPFSTTVVHVTTPSRGAMTYTVSLSPDIFTPIIFGGDTTKVTVDANGNPVGNQKLPFSVMPVAIQNGLNALAPAATSLSSDSTKNVTVETADGATTYAVVYKTTGVRTRVTVNSSGQPADVPTSVATIYQDLPTAAQSGLQTLADEYATSVGITPHTLSSNDSVVVYAEADGTSIYTITTYFFQKSKSTSKSHEFVTGVLSVDQNGNPTVLPADAPSPSFPSNSPFPA